MRTLLISLTLFAFIACTQKEGLDSVNPADGYTLIADNNYISGFSAQNDNGSVNVVVEIPAGTNAKWEVVKPDGVMEWEIKNGERRVVQYLPYPGNYGMVPRTLLPRENGGDGDPLDVLLLGTSVQRGMVVEAKIIGVLRLIDEGEQDDKLLAVMMEGPLSEVENLSTLSKNYPGVLDIVEIWFENYKGPKKLHSNGFADVDEARKILKRSITAYEAGI